MSRAISALAPARRAATAWPSSWASVSTAIAPANHHPNGCGLRTIATARKARKPIRIVTGKPSTRTVRCYVAPHRTLGSPRRAGDSIGSRAVRLLIRSQAPPSPDGDEGPPRWEGGEPRRDDERAQAAGAARLHDLDRRLPRLHARRLARRPRRRDRHAGDRARAEDGSQPGRSDRPAAGQRALR